MTNEMILRYLYYFTVMYKGTKEWDRCYDAWTNFANSISDEEYSKCIREVTKFDKQYRIKN
jgi:hypothetical protein